MNDWITLSRHVASTWHDEAGSALHKAAICYEEALSAHNAHRPHAAQLRLEMIKHQARNAINAGRSLEQRRAALETISASLNPTDKYWNDENHQITSVIEHIATLHKCVSDTVDTINYLHSQVLKLIID